MGHPAGATTKQLEEQARVRDRVKGAAAYIVASLIDRYLKYDAKTLQVEYGLSVIEATQVVAKLKAMQQAIDPDGNWR